MLHESRNLTISTCEGVATLWLHFPGTPVNAWNRARIAEFDNVWGILERDPSLEVAVIRSGKPGGFCGGFDPAALDDLSNDSNAAAFALAGQRLCNCIRNAPFVTIAFIEGPCLGPGFDLALACDDRLAVAGADSALGFGSAPTGWGGFTALKQRIGERKTKQFFGEPRTPREAVALGAIDHAFCERRAKIELQTWLDARLANPRKRRDGWRSWFATAPTEAAERQMFVDAVRAGYPEIVYESFEPLPKAVTVRADRQQAIEYAARGVAVTFEGTVTFTEADFTARGRLTPLEASQALKRITVVPVPERKSSPVRQLQYAA